jgi:ubiquinone/menaquinone biosynthesis C-methylase UbiE
MTEDIFFEIHSDLPREGYGRDKYTARAFRMIPKIERPKILDIGCGPGAQTLEIARLSGGQVTGIDTHQPYLDILLKKADEQSLSDNIRALNMSMKKMSFPEESFDILWSEGSIYIIGFDQALQQWRHLIKPNGFLAVHEMVWLQPDPPLEIKDYIQTMYPGIRSIEENLNQIPSSLYTVIGHFQLPEDAWWVEYYHPLESRLNNLRKKYHNNSHALDVIEKEQTEIDMYKKYSLWYGSCFYILQKKEDSS